MDAKLSEIMKITDQTLQSAKEVIGQHLSERREAKGITKYQLQKQYGIRYEAIDAIETGVGNPTLESFLRYLHGIDCYFYVADKKGKHLDHEDLIDKMKEDPEKN